MSRARRCAARRSGPHHHRLLHRLHDSLAGRPSHQHYGLPLECSPHALHRTRLRRRSDGLGTRCRFPQSPSRRKCAHHRRRTSISHLSAQGYFPSQSHFFDSLWRRRGRRARQRQKHARSQDFGLRNLHLPGFPRRHGLRPPRFGISHPARQRRPGNDRRKNSRPHRRLSRAPWQNTARHQGLDTASRRRAPARQYRDCSRPDEVPDPAILGRPRKRRQPFQRHHPLHPPGMAGEAPLEPRRVRARGRLRARVQRGIFAPPMDLSLIAFLLLLAAVAALRLVELGISRRHQQQLVARGAAKVDEPRFRWMVLLHTAVLIGAALEVILLKRTFLPLLAAIMFAVFLAANGVRWWVIRTLGDHWNVQVMDSTRLGVVTSGPFRFVRHPNYAAVFAEMLSLPLIHTAWITSLAGSLAHIGVLSQRLSTEERVLFANPDYRAAMAGKPRFLPGLF